MKILDNADTKIFALGGLGEVGKNMYCVMHENEIIIKGIIPKDTEYYVNSEQEIVSSTIIVTDKIIC